MKRSLLWVFSVLVLGVVLALLPVTAAAQTIWTSSERTTNLTLEWLRPDFEEGDDVSFFTSGLFLSGRLAVSDKLNLVADLPFAYYDAEVSSGGGNESDATIGNPYLGLEVGRVDSPIWGELGLRVPLAPSDNLAVGSGFYSDYDRCEAFMPDILSFVGIANYQYRHDTGFSMRLRGGPLVLVDTDEALADSDSEVYAIYSLQGWYDTARMRFGAGFTGRLWASESDLDFKERSVHHLGLAMAGKFRGVEPGLHFRLPLDEDLTDYMNYVFGINVTVPLTQR